MVFCGAPADSGLEPREATVTVTMAMERWTSKHTWRRVSNFVYDTYPPMYDWECRRCGQYERATKPAKSECPGLVAQSTESKP